MSDSETTPEAETEATTPEEEVNAEEGAATEASSEGDQTKVEQPSEVAVKTPEFMPLQERSVPGDAASMERFYDVRVPVWAELGRVEMQLGDLLQLGEGTVLRLDRPVGEPVDLVSQGVKLARGEVVVVDDSFAVRIREIMSTEK